MKIEYYTTDLFTPDDWNSYIISFNKTFNKTYDIEFFKHKYLKTIDGFAHHAIMRNDLNEIVGACTITTALYNANNEILKIGLAVDLFIVEEFRQDSLAFLKMYMLLKKKLADTDVKVVVAVPNSNSYAYWRKLVKWKDVGTLSYYIIPFNIANVISKIFILNPISRIYAYLNLYLNILISYIFNTKSPKAKYNLQLDPGMKEYRFHGDYHRIKSKNIDCFYSIVNEDGVISAYLLSAEQNGLITLKALITGVKDILKNHKVDIIIYVGQLRLFQFLFIKVPKKYEPKSLPLILDVIKKEEQEKFSDMLNLKNWDFGLVNYDVR